MISVLGIGNSTVKQVPSPSSTFNEDASAVGLDDLLGDGQSESR